MVPNSKQSSFGVIPWIHVLVGTGTAERRTSTPTQEIFRSKRARFADAGRHHGESQDACR